MDKETIDLLMAVLGGGVGVKMLEKGIDLIANRGKSVREELRRLEAKIDTLEAEIEVWKTTVDEWRNKYYSLWDRHQLVKVELALLTGKPYIEEKSDG